MNTLINTAKLAYYMELKNLKKSTLADKAEVSKNTITSIFKNKDITLSSARKICKTLEIQPRDAGEIFLS